MKIGMELAKSMGVTLTPETLHMNGTRYCALNDILCQKGRLGRKAGMYVNMDTPMNFF